jgi:ABC-2 type transport system ATP-binding protein
MPAALEIRDLRKTFKTFSLGPLDLTVPDGSIYGFVGPNGAGKTTTIDLLFGMGAKDAGTMAVYGLDHLRDEVAVRQQTAYVGPDLSFQSWRRVDRALQFVRGFYPDWDQSRCDRLLALFGLSPADLIATLSFGARTKLSLVMALSWRPRLLVLDEPTVGLDAIAKQALFAELLALVRNEGRSVFISSHAITDLERFADHVAMIKNGHIVFEGATDAIVDRYRIVEFMAGQPVDLGQQPGIRVQQHEDNRWRVLLDRTQTSVGALAQRGIVPIAESPVSLEELFVALGRA